jgi:hypothetical protein
VYKASIIVEVALSFAIYSLAPSAAFQVLFTGKPLAVVVSTKRERGDAQLFVT